MNELVHFFIGYLVLLLFVKKNEISNQNQNHIRNFLLFYGGFAALIPDIMEYPFFGLGHGTWTHTILFGTILSIIVTTLIYLLAKPEFHNENLPYHQILFVFWLATMSHLVLDIGTHTKFECIQAEAEMRHLYFWPIWNKSFHLDCLFGWSYSIRILIEWAIVVPFLIGILVWRLKKRQENPFRVFNPKLWWGNREISKKWPIRLILIPIFLYSVLLIYIFRYFL